MQSTIIPTTALRASRIGFGTAAITTMSDRRSALRLLNAAFDSGITHFDTARLYGFGHAEGILGEFLVDKRDAVTVATKFGLEPPSGPVNNARMLAVAKRLLKRVPAIRNRLSRRVHGLVKAGGFSPAAAARSIEKSLSELRTDHIDLLLLHECSLADAQRDDLLEFLEQQVARGVVRELGIATSAEQLRGDVSSVPSRYRVVQLQNNMLDLQTRIVKGLQMRGVITHSAIKPLAEIKRYASDPANAQSMHEWADVGGPDPRDATAIVRLLLAFALAENPHGVVLYATTHPGRIAETVVGLDDPTLAEQAIRFGKFVERLQIGRPMSIA